MLSQSTLQFIARHENDDIRQLALKAASREADGVDFALALTQIAGRQVARVKIPSWYARENILYPKHLSLEQCSSEPTALYKSSLLSGNTFADLTGGMGVDCAFISSRFQHAVYVEQQPELAELAALNFSVLGLLQLEVANSTAEAYLQTMQPVDCIFLDPARRSDTGRKTVRIEDCTPDVGALQEELLAKADRVLVKLSPMLDITLALTVLKQVKEVHVVSVDNECKELLFLLTHEAVTEPEIIAVNLKKNGTTDAYRFFRSEQQSASVRYTAQLGTYLYEPNASLMKAGAYRSVADRFGLSKLHPDSHLYTSDERIESFPGRTFEVQFVSGTGKKEIKQLLSPLKQANLSVRNYPSSVADLRKKLSLSDGGDYYLFATTLQDARKVILACKRI